MNKCNGQSRMNNAEILATLDTQDTHTEDIQNKIKQTKLNLLETSLWSMYYQ